MIGGLWLCRYSRPLRICRHQCFTAHMFTLLCLCLYLITTRRKTTIKFCPRRQDQSSTLKKEETFATGQKKKVDSLQPDMKKATTLIATGPEKVSRLLAEGAGGEHLGDEVDVAARDVDPGGVELHDVAVLERLEEVDLAVKPLQVLGALQEVEQLHLVPRHLHPLVFVERPIPAAPAHTPRIRDSGGKQNEIKQLWQERGRILHSL